MCSTSGCRGNYLWTCEGKGTSFVCYTRGTFKRFENMAATHSRDPLLFPENQWTLNTQRATLVVGERLAVVKSPAQYFCYVCVLYKCLVCILGRFFTPLYSKPTAICSMCKVIKRLGVQNDTNRNSFPFGGLDRSWSTVIVPLAIMCFHFGI